ncbi:AraC family transcriptional regulator [Microbulbifer sp. SA54]|uniref:AraC family transcriptional regulator n=1 Tax=Microbulbifer sp. SA54 TaxID=3401577 RepID=UPI003AAE6F80
MADISIPLYFVKSVIRHAKQYGLDSSQLLRRSRISPRLLQGSQARVSAEQYARLQTLTMREMGDEMLGYCPQPSRIGQWSALCHWLIRCRNLGQVLKRCSLFFAIVEKSFLLELTIADEEAILAIRPAAGNATPPAPFAYELFAFSLHRQLCWLTKSNIPLQRVALPYPEPEHIGEYSALLAGAPAKFGAQECQLVFSRKLLQMPVAQTPDTLAEFLRKPLYNFLVNSFQATSWHQRIKALIGSDLSKLPTFEEIASTLEQNPKRLRRLLNDEGLTYSDLKLQLRRDIAINHLARKKYSIEYIAQKTGFSEASAFIRAFKMWTGVTPLTYRKDLV